MITAKEARTLTEQSSAEMEYTNKDMQEDYKDLYNQLTTITRRDYYITCPCCGERIPVEKL